MVDRAEHKAVAGWMTFTMFVGAAYSDCTGPQREELRRHLNPVLRQLKQKDLNGEQVRHLVRTALKYTQVVMGDDWAPTGEWMVTIKSMLGEVR